MQDVTDYGPHSTDAAPTQWIACDAPRCTVTYRAGSECSRHGRYARAQHRISELELERKLLLSTTGASTHPSVLSRLKALETRVRILRNYEPGVRVAVRS